MRDGGSRRRVVVPTGGDALRQERLTRDLYDSLREADGLTVGFGDGEGLAEPGSKGAGAGDVALWAATATAVARPASRVLVRGGAPCSSTSTSAATRTSPRSPTISSTTVT
jgi:hypothetical protein